MNDKVSARTRERAYTLAKNAKSIGIDPGRPRFSGNHDFICNFFTNGVEFVIVYSTPACYLTELWFPDDDSDKFHSEFGTVTNIRHYLFGLRSDEFVSCEDYFAELIGDENIDIHDVIQEILDEDIE